MKKVILILTALLLGAAALRAQEVVELPEPEEIPAALDSTLLGRDILKVIGPGIKISQSPAVREALGLYVKSNAVRPLTGYRIRVFYDNDSQSRVRSENIAAALREQFRAPVYRSFESPNYKVTIGDFRTKDEALRIYNALKWTYPTAYIIKETINYPR